MGSVEIHWDTASGPLLGTATGPGFELPIAVPSGASPGVHYVVAIGSSSDQYHATVPAVFEVMAPPTVPPSPRHDISPPTPEPAPTSAGKTIVGTSGSDTLTGTPFGDVIDCGAGADVVHGGGGDDVINCGAGNVR